MIMPYIVVRRVGRRRPAAASSSKRHEHEERGGAVAFRPKSFRRLSPRAQEAARATAAVARGGTTRASPEAEQNTRAARGNNRTRVARGQTEHTRRCRIPWWRGTLENEPKRNPRATTNRGTHLERRDRLNVRRAVRLRHRHACDRRGRGVLNQRLGRRGGRRGGRGGGGDFGANGCRMCAVAAPNSVPREAETCRARLHRRLRGRRNRRATRWRRATRAGGAAVVSDARGGERRGRGNRPRRPGRTSCAARGTRWGGVVRSQGPSDKGGRFGG